MLKMVILPKKVAKIESTYSIILLVKKTVYCYTGVAVITFTKIYICGGAF